MGSSNVLFPDFVGRVNSMLFMLITICISGKLNSFKIVRERSTPLEAALQSQRPSMLRSLYFNWVVIVFSINAFYVIWLYSALNSGIILLLLPS